MLQSVRSKQYWLEQHFNGCRVNPNQDLPEKWSRGSERKIEIICSCGKKFLPRFNNLTSAASKSCGHTRTIGYKKLIHKLYSKQYWLKQDFNGCKINSNQDLPEKWSQGSTQRIEIICNCGKIFVPYFYNLTSGKSSSCGCSKLFYSVYSKQYWLDQTFYDGCKINPGQKLPNEWSQGSYKKFEIECSCGKIFAPVFRDFTSGNSKSCGHYSQSQGEKELGELLERLFPNLVTSQDDLDFLCHKKPLRVDFAIRDLKLAFEFDGQQHFRSIKRYGGERGLKLTQQRDKKKEKLLKKNGYTLIRIRYDQDIKRQLFNDLEEVRYVT